jgi:oligoribonuclease
MINEHNLLWLDLEMTGLEPTYDHILQMAAVVTDQNLTVRAEGPELIIHQPIEHMKTIPPIVQKMHTQSGLLNKVAESTISVVEAEQTMINFVKHYCIPGRTLLCGNSIWVDRAFLKRYMPQLEALFHYRMIDVSSVKELILHWYPQHPPFKKEKEHTALADVYESIAELKYYRTHYFNEKA